MHPDGLEARLQHRFADPALLSQALTHRSFGVPHNERLEFLGDGVLNCAIARLVFDRHPGMPEGELSRLRAHLVNQSTLADVARELQVGALLRMGEGEVKTGGAERASILADAVEAILGAVSLDAGYEPAAALVARLFASRLSAAPGEGTRRDAKTALQEWLQARRLALPRYAVERIEGEAHRQTFHVLCEVAELAVTTTGAGSSRRLAEQEAAAAALARLEAS